VCIISIFCYYEDARMKLLRSFAAIIHLPKKVLLPGIVILLIIGWFVFSPKKAATPIQTAAVTRSDIQSTVGASGTLAGKDSATLRFRSGGKLASLNVKVGDEVTAGQTIAGLDTQDLNITLSQAWNNYRDKQAVVQKILDDVKDHDSDETFAQKQARTTAEVARDNAYESVKAAQRAFQDAVIVAPIAGTITAADPVAGQFVSPTDTITQIVDWSDIYFDTEVDEADISKVSLGQLANVTLNAYPDQTFKGTVAEIKPNTKTTSNGATVVIVRINLGHPNVKLISNLNGQATIVTSEVHNALTIPQEALKDDDTVVVSKDQSFTTVKVEPGIRSDTDVEIKNGLSEGQTVVKNPSAVPSTAPNTSGFRLRIPGVSGRR
jgi:macrolide-specific efflux system membrane fusion protein